MTNIAQDNDSEARADGQQVITACAFIHQTFDGVEKVFLARRAVTKMLFPGVYELPGGHIEFGEDITRGLKREINEELGMSVELGDPFTILTYLNAIKHSHSIEVVYFGRFSSSLDSLRLNDEDHSSYGWFAEGELADATTEAKGLGDDEFVAMRKGFALLRGEPLEF